MTNRKVSKGDSFRICNTKKDFSKTISLLESPIGKAMRKERRKQESVRKTVSFGFDKCCDVDRSGDRKTCSVRDLYCMPCAMFVYCNVTVKLILYTPTVSYDQVRSGIAERAPDRQIATAMNDDPMTCSTMLHNLPKPPKKPLQQFDVKK